MSPLNTNWQWSEFEWEREIQRDEQRICSYFETLPCYLDLPGEDDAIFMKLSAQKELAPVHGGIWWQTTEELAGLSDGAEDEIEESPEENVARLRNKTGFDLFKLMEHSAREWNALSCKRFPAEDAEKVLKFCCFYGKILSHCNNYLNLSPNDDPESLHRSILKRILKELNCLVGEFLSLGNERYDLLAELNLFVDDLQQARERTLRLMFTGRND